MGNGRNANIRIGSTERENAVAALGEHLGEGRLEVSEYDQRCGLAAAARTRGELAAIFEDLPDPHPDFGVTEPERAEEQPASRALIENNPTRKQTTILLVGLLVFAVVAVTVVTALTGAWWAFIPILIVIGLLAMMS